MKRTNDQLSTDDLIGFAPFKKKSWPDIQWMEIADYSRIIREISSEGGGGERRRVKDISDGNLNVIRIMTRKC